jgi:hypothetical protein
MHDAAPEAEAFAYPDPRTARFYVYARARVERPIFNQRESPSLAELDALFASLRYRAFRGEL